MKTEAQHGQITATAGNIESGRIEVPHTTGDGHIRTIGGTVLLHEAGRQMASMSFLAMKRFWDHAILDDMVAKRPITFVMNGGPSAPATEWNLQTLTGPYFVSHDLDGHLPKQAGYRFMQSAGSPVNHTDVVHIDPVGTGLGRTLEGVDPDWAYNSVTDAETKAGFIDWYLQEHGNDNPNIVLAVSSFSALQAPLITLNLARRGINVKGMAIMSGAYDYSMIDYSNPDNHKAFINALPAIAVAAQYHRKPKAEYCWQWDIDDQKELANAERLFDEVRAFAEDKKSGYAALLGSDRLPGARRTKIIRKLSELPHIHFLDPKEKRPYSFG
jgi:carboxypeptidase C (cathepsin A)